MGTIGRFACRGAKRLDLFAQIGQLPLHPLQALDGL
jgi:hypothetical protein